MSALPLPNADRLRATLTGLLGRIVMVNDGAATVPEPGDVIACWQADDGDAFAVATVSVPLAASLGAALAMVPRGIAEDIVHDRAYGATIVLDSLGEVMNILTADFAGSGSPHLKFRDITVVPDAVAPDVQAVLDDAAHRVSYTVDVDGYLSGSLSFATR